MARLKPETIIADAEDARRKFQERDKKLQERVDLRFGNYEVEIPLAYQKTSEVYKSPVLDEEGRQIAALVAAQPIMHVIPGKTEWQPQSTTMEQFGHAAMQQFTYHYGAIDDKCSLSQIHDKIGWIYLGFKRDYYGGAPKPTGNMVFDAYAKDDYKREAGICALFDMRHVPTNTLYWTGPASNPTRVWEIKMVDEFDIISNYGLTQNKNGDWSKIDEQTMLSGTPEYYPQKNTARLIKFIEYWDRESCHLICVNPLKGWLGTQFMTSDQVYELDYWKHDWGRVPYFARPAFETDQMAEEYRFASPMDSLYTEIKTYNRVRTVFSSIVYMTGFAPLKVVTKEGNQLIMDDQTGKMKTTLEFEPGKPTQLGVGQDVLPVVVSPEGNIVSQEVAAAEMRVQKYSVSEIARGVSPGADTANSALSTLRRMQRSSLSKLNENQARQYHDMWEFMFKRLKETGETVYVFDVGVDDTLALGPEDIVTLNFNVKADADIGMDKLTEEKAALEAYQLGAIAEQEYHERRGKENPEEYVLASALDRLRRSFEPEMFDGIKALFGQSSALARMVMKQRETGNAQDAIPEILNDITGIQNGGQPPTGMGEGSPGQPRQEAVRSPFNQQTTQPQGPYGAE